MEIFSLLTLLFASGGIYALYKMWPNVRPGNSKIQNDLKLMKEEMDQWSNDLVEFEKQELEALSFNQIKKSQSKNFTQTAKGIFTTIFHEPVIAYSYKKYRSSKEYAILYARTLKDTFVYKIDKKEIRMVLNDKLIGVFDRGMLTLHDNPKNKPKARLVKDKSGLLYSIVYDTIDLGSFYILPAATEKKGLSARVFQFTRQELGKDDLRFVLLLTIPELVRIT